MSDTVTFSRVCFGGGSYRIPHILDTCTVHLIGDHPAHSCCRALLIRVMYTACLMHATTVVMVENLRGETSTAMTLSVWRLRSAADDCNETNKHSKKC